MAITQVIARVLDRVEVVDESVRRPVRLTPDGFAGVVYAGAVYPLLPDNLVDISGPSWEIEDCQRFLFAGTAIPYAPSHGAMTAGQDPTGFSGEWNVETNAFGHNVVFNASERVAGQLVDALEKAGLSVQRWDVSHRLATDGRFYDWFARLRYKGSHDECVARVSAAFLPAPVPVREAPQLELERLADLEAQVERLLDQTVQLNNQLAAGEREAALLRAQLQDASAREAELTGALDLARRAETDELLEMALAENADLLRRVSALRQRLAQGDARVQTLEAMVADLQQRLEEVSEQEEERHRSAAARVAPRRGTVGFLDIAFSRLALILDSAEVLANFESPAAALRALMQIDMGVQIGKDVEGIRGWREVSKIATGIPGSENMGRIYFKPDGDRVLVSVHIKHDNKEQRRHLDRLRRF